MVNYSELELLGFYPFNENESDNNILVDVGAHHGSVSKTFAKKGWDVIAFEPEEKNRNALKKNLNSFRTVKIISKAVSDKNDEIIPFYTSQKHYGIHSIKPFHDTHKFAYEVKSTTLNSSLEEEEIKKVTFLKIDIEGADFLALKGFHILKYNPEIIMLEFMDDRSSENFGYTHHDVVKYMASYPYICYVSEWAPIKEYGIEGVRSEPHTWINISKYPLNHNPAWGNLIFIKTESDKKFQRTINRYLKRIGVKKDRLAPIKKRILRIPLTQFIYKKFIK